MPTDFDTVEKFATFLTAVAGGATAAAVAISRHTPTRRVLEQFRSKRELILERDLALSRAMHGLELAERARESAEAAKMVAELMRESLGMLQSDLHRDLVSQEFTMQLGLAFTYIEALSVYTELLIDLLKSNDVAEIPPAPLMSSDLEKLARAHGVSLPTFCTIVSTKDYGP